MVTARLWGSSLFEDAAEYGFGMFSAVKHRREKLADIVAEAANLPDLPEGLVDALNGWLETRKTPKVPRSSVKKSLPRCPTLGT